MAEYIEREAAYKDFEKCNSENPKWTPSRVKTLMTRQKAANVAPVQKWIPVTERLPEEEGLYLVAVVNDHERRYSKTAWYHGHGNWFLHQKSHPLDAASRATKGEIVMAEYFAGGHLRFVNGEWRDDNGDAIEISRVRHGRWIDAYPDIEPNPMFMYGICSECGFEQSISKYLNYCPNCGAKMDGGDGNIAMA